MRTKKSITRTTERTRKASTLAGAKSEVKRLTLDIPADLHRSVKLESVRRGVTMVDMVRELLEKSFR